MLGQSSALLQHATPGISFGFQVAAVAATVAIALAGGTLAGLLVSWINPADQNLTAAQLFDDGAYWMVRLSCQTTSLRDEMTSISLGDERPLAVLRDNFIHSFQARVLGGS